MRCLRKLFSPFKKLLFFFEGSAGLPFLFVRLSKKGLVFERLRILLIKSLGSLKIFMLKHLLI